MLTGKPLGRSGIRSVVAHLLGGQVGHAPGHLVGPGDQLRDPHPAQGHLPGPAAVLLALGPAGAQVVPEVPPGRVLHHHVQRTWTKGAETNHVNPSQSTVECTEDLDGGERTPTTSTHHSLHSLIK